MFHLEFRQNQHHLDIEVHQARQLFNEVNSQLNTEGTQESRINDCVQQQKSKEIQKEAAPPINNEYIEENQPTKKANTHRHPFVYESNGKLLVFLSMSDDYIMKCPMCLIETKYIIQHVSKKKDCKISGDLDSFKDKFRVYKQYYTQELKRKIKQRSDIKRREENLVKVKVDQVRRKESSRIKLNKKENDKVKVQQRVIKQRSDLKKREENLVKVKVDQVKRKESSRIKLKQQEYDEVKVHQRAIKQRSDLKKEKKTLSK